MSKRPTKEEDVGAIDLTPMLDVVFIMLIFFIVTASFIKEAGIDVNRPDATTSLLKKNANILVAISANNEIWIAKQQVDERDIKSHIERLYAENPKGALVIQADNDAQIEFVAKVVEAAREVTVLDVSVATNK
ncbi:ExbD/TolR family protein [Simiduia agarivorans]|uniref:Branched-chain amino acid aminotransferase I n=1 Tax=Simiduia agarivorans (strain DSM 21679 / JCM 13881 / BCRC 17597 / SA1) TaxID=1117647 RepID=K4KNP0_SIMAS|nr:biopolymer transporter ExbD [Simiduia agarivorans]AFU99855.1 branched-chain amino acid aminotransferase I [Simiduia agarivorans SA1 = DSM 21679]